jgi:hypothetical protein
MLRASGEPVARPDENHIKSAAMCIVQKTIQRWTPHLTWAAITSLAVCALEVEGREVTLLVSFVGLCCSRGESSVFEWRCCVC